MSQKDRAKEVKEMFPTIALVKFKESSRTFNFLVGIKDVKDFDPVSCQHFVKDLQYMVKWQKSDIDSNGYYPAYILALSLTYQEMAAKINKNKWKEPMNMSSFGNVEEGKKASRQLRNQSTKSSNSKPEGKKPVKKHLKEKFSSNAAALQRMENVIEKLTESDDKISSKVVKQSSPQASEDMLDGTQLIDGDDFISGSDDEDVASKFVELEKSYKKLEKKFASLEKIHLSCSATIKASDSLRLKYYEENRMLTNTLEDFKATANKKIQALALQIVKLQKENADLKTDASKNAHATELPDCNYEDSTSGYESIIGKTKREIDFDKYLTDSSTPKKAKASSSSSFIDLQGTNNFDNELDFSATVAVASTPKKVRCNDKEDNAIAKRVELDITNQTKLEERDGKVYLGYNTWIKAEMWKKKLRNAETDTQFINRFPVALWNPENLPLRTLEGRKGKLKATPEKTSIIMASLKGRLEALKEPNDALELRMAKAKTTLSRKFTEFARPPRPPRSNKND